MVNQEIMNFFKCSGGLQTLSESYTTSILYQKGKLDKKIYSDYIIKFYKQNLNINIQICSGCSSSLNAEHTRFQMLVLKILLSIYPQYMPKIDESLFDYKYFEQKRELILTSSFETFINIYNRFENDYLNKRTGLTNKNEFEIAKKILIDFNTNRQNIEIDFTTTKLVEPTKVKKQISDSDIYEFYKIEMNVEKVAKHFEVSKRMVGNIIKKFTNG